MAVRATMAGLLTRLRRLAGDQASSPTWDDQSLQDAMDVYQCWTRYAMLRAQAFIQPGGKRIWTDFYADALGGDWETDVALYDATYNALAPDTSDFITGHWVFNAGIQNGVVWIVGKSYDLYGAAADVLVEWAAKVKQEYDFMSQMDRYLRSQQAGRMQELAATYRLKQKPMLVDMVRGDVPAGRADWPDGLQRGR